MDDNKSKSSQKKWLWLLGGVAALLLFVGVLGAVFLPIFVVQWLGGDQFRQLASRQVSTLLGTEGEFGPFEWSSFSVYTSGFTSHPKAPGKFNYRVEEIRTEISPRLLLDRILRFDEIHIGTFTLSEGTGLPLALTPPEPNPSASGGAKQDIFHDVQIGKVIVDRLGVQAGSFSSGWGTDGSRLTLRPGKQSNEFDLQGGKIISPVQWLGQTEIYKIQGRFQKDSIFLTEAEIRSDSGGKMRASGERLEGNPPQMRGEMSWEKWQVPGGKIGVGLFDIPARMSGTFRLANWTAQGPIGDGEVSLVDARLEPGKGSETILGLLAALTGEPRLRGCPLTTAKARWSLRPGNCEIESLEAEAPGLLRVEGRVKIQGDRLDGIIQLGLENGLGQKVSALTSGQCFANARNGFLYQPIKIWGTMDKPENDLQGKLVSATAQTVIRTGAQILEKATGAQGGGSTGDVINGVMRSLFKAPGGP